MIATLTREDTAARATPAAPVTAPKSGNEQLLQSLLVGAASTITILVPDHAADRIEFSPVVVDHIQRRFGNMRVILAAGTMDIPVVRDYVEYLAARGVIARTAPSVPGRAIVIDGRIGIIGDAVVRDATTMRNLLRTCDELWRHGMPVGCKKGGAMAERQAKIVELLANGHTDEGIASRVGVSVRTVRADVATLMRQVSATSRFQAGVLMTRLGMV